jgi:hypothetical protein
MTVSLQNYQVIDATNNTTATIGTANSGATNSTALNTLLAAVVAAAGQKSVVYIPAGVYSFASTVTLSAASGLTIEGDGPGRTTLRWTGTSTYDPKSTSLTGSPLLLLADCNECVVRDLSIDTFASLLDEGVRIAKTTGASTVSTHNVLERVNIGSSITAGSQILLQTGVRLGSNGASPNNHLNDQNNDVHAIRDCSITYYADAAIAIEDSQIFQVLIENCRLLGAWTYDENGVTDNRLAVSINAAGDQLTLTGTGVLGAKDQYRFIEVSSSGAMGDPNYVRTQITNVTTAAGNTVLTVSPAVAGGAKASAKRVRYGSQRGIRNAQGNLEGGGNFEFIGGGGSQHLDADFYIAGADGSNGACTVRSTGFEGSRMFVRSGSLALGTEKKLLVDDVRVAGNGSKSWYPYVIEWNLGGQVMVINTSLGDFALGGAAPPIKLNMPNFSYPFSPPGAQEYCMFVLDNVIIQSSYSTTSLFNGGFPNDIRNSRLCDGTNVFLLGTPADRMYVDASPITNPIQLNFGRSKTLTVVLAANSAFTFAKPYTGLDTPMTLFVTHSGGPWTMAWPANVKWTTASAPVGIANGTSIYQFRYDGTTIWGSRLFQSGPTITGAKGGNAALTSLLTQLANLGLVVDTTT